jgi:hypothetical protein
MVTLWLPAPVAHEGETALLEAYLQQARRPSGGVLAIGGDVVLMNPTCV